MGKNELTIYIILICLVAIFSFIMGAWYSLPTKEERAKIEMYDDLEQCYEDLAKQYNLLLIENRSKEEHINWLNDQIVILQGE